MSVTAPVLSALSVQPFPGLKSVAVASQGCPPPQTTASVGPDVDLMVGREEVVIKEPTVVEDFGSEEVKTSGAGGRPPKKSKVLITLSDDLSYTLTIDGDSLSSVMDSIAADEYMKNEWNSWQRFLQNPNQFFVYIFDNDFKEYVRYRTGIPIRHLSKIKIRNKFYVNQTGLKNGYQHLIVSQSPVIEDEEPTDALFGDQNNNNSSLSPTDGSAPTPHTTTIQQSVKNHNNAFNNDIISHNASNASQYHHNYHMSSPSAPTSHLSVSSCPTAGPEADINTTITAQNSSQSSKLTKAAKKLFNTTEANHRIKSKSSDTDSLSGDLLADAPTGPTFDWTQEQTIASLELCKKYSKELAPKRNALEVKPTVWEQLAKELSIKEFGHSSDALMCRNHFSRLRLTYTNVLCYPTLRDESRWPYFKLKEIIGEKPEEIQSKVKTRAHYKAKMAAPGLVQAIKRIQSNRKPAAATSGGVRKNSANKKVNEVHVALLNLVKKYMKYFETEKKNRIWTRIENEMKNAGYKWTANAGRELFYRHCFTYIKMLRNVGENDSITESV